MLALLAKKSLKKFPHFPTNIRVPFELLQKDKKPMEIPLEKLLMYIIKMLESEIESCKDEIEAKTMILKQLKKKKGRL